MFSDLEPLKLAILVQLCNNVSELVRGFLHRAGSKGLSTLLAISALYHVGALENDVVKKQFLGSRQPIRV